MKGNDMRHRHVIRAQQFDRPWLEGLFAMAREMEAAVACGGTGELRGRILATLFYQPSTRTRLSFETAMLRLGGQVISTENAKEFSSAAKGESLEDTIRVVAGYADVIVLRHYELGSSERAAALDAAPIINAGDGPGQHPTQALLDLYTIQREIGRLNGIRVAMVGDLKYGRTVRSLAYLLAKFEDVRMSFVAPGICRIGDDIKAYLDRHGVPYEETDDLPAVCRQADVVYQTRIQKEAFSFEDLRNEYENARRQFVITPELVAAMRPKAVIMHPLPRVGEIDTEVDADGRAAYFRQAKNGLYVRMAVLSRVFSAQCGASKELDHEDLD
jgi:aspartate carbamoyltransferase catalytic subunit